LTGSKGINITEGGMPAENAEGVSVLWQEEFSILRNNKKANSKIIIPET
jgi:hypothetical protein